MQRAGRPVLEDPLVKARLAAIEMRIIATDLTNLRFLRAAECNKTADLPAPYLKILSSHLQQDIAELQMRTIGAQALAVRSVAPTNQRLGLASEQATVAPTYCNLRKTTIYAGCNEIQRNIAAKNLLG